MTVEARNYGVRDAAVRLTSLEEVFIALASEAEEKFGTA